MKLLKEIYRSECLDIKNGKIEIREAVRGIIHNKNNLLMIYSPVNGDYKFPGGGVEEGEDRISALSREVREESGVEMLSVESEFGKVIEYDVSMYDRYDVFKMISYYYICRVASKFIGLNLDDYEKELEFMPVWADILDVIGKNRQLLDSGQRLPKWVVRDTFVLEEVRRRILCD